MKKKFASCFFISLIMLTLPVIAESAPPTVGEKLPDIRLSFPKSPEHLAYLGLAGQGDSFGPAQIRAEVVIIQIFSMYSELIWKIRNS